jgi:adenylate cyclase
MDETAFNALAGWVTEAGLIGRTETELMAGFCRRVVDAGVPLARAMVILDTLHPVYEGRAFRWRADAAEVAEAVDYARTNEGEAAENWRRSPFFHLLQSGEQAMRRCLVAGDPADFPTFAQARDGGRPTSWCSFIGLPPRASLARWIASIRPGLAMRRTASARAPSLP